MMNNEKYPMNLLYAIGNKIPDKVTADIRAGIEYAISELGVIEQNIISERFLEGKSVTETAEKFNLSEQCIMEIEQEALRNLRLPERYIYIEKGMHCYIMSVYSYAYKKGYDNH